MTTATLPRRAARGPELIMTFPPTVYTGGWWNTEVHQDAYTGITFRRDREALDQVLSALKKWQTS